MSRSREGHPVKGVDNIEGLKLERLSSEPTLIEAWDSEQLRATSRNCGGRKGSHVKSAIWLSSDYSQLHFANISHFLLDCLQSPHWISTGKREDIYTRRMEVDRSTSKDAKDLNRCLSSTRRASFSFLSLPWCSGIYTAGQQRYVLIIHT